MLGNHYPIYAVYYKLENLTSISTEHSYITEFDDKKTTFSKSTILKLTYVRLIFCVSEIKSPIIYISSLQRYKIIRNNS